MTQLTWLSARPFGNGRVPVYICVYDATLQPVTTAVLSRPALV